MCVHSQRFDGTQRGEQAFADGLKLVVVERQQVEFLQVFESVHPKTVDLVGVQESGRVNRRFITLKSCQCKHILTLTYLARGK